jgi:hypothetical protein
MKIICTECKEPKNPEELVKNRKVCKVCRVRRTVLWQQRNKEKIGAKGKRWREEHKEQIKAYHKHWYATHKEAHKARVQSAAQLNRQRFIAWKAQQHCCRCPENHPACLEFHHRNPAQKEMNISQAWRLGYSWEHLMREIAKCDILCANCHRKLHYEEGRTNKKIARDFKNVDSYRILKTNITAVQRI